MVFVSGMHVQRRQIEDIRRRAHALDRVAVLGGSSVSACPEHYPDFDYLHVGELGDATDELFARLDATTSRARRARSCSPPRERRELTEFPIPAYELAQIDRYLLGSIQFSSGCPYQCEFCDIPALYGRVARYKTAEQVCAELDKLVACGLSTSVYFVDDNFIANKRAVREMLPHLIEWQKRNGYPLLLSCEATLNIAKRPEILELMREAAFTTIFCGIETPDPEALKSISKEHNMMVPILGAIETLNSFGMEVVSGIILGLDTDTPDTGENLLEVRRAVADSDADHEPAAGAAAHAAVGSAQARAAADRGRRRPRIERRVPDALRPGAGDVARMHARRLSAGSAVSPAMSTRSARPMPTACACRTARQRASWRNIRRALIMLSRIFWFVGVKGDYRRVFWRFALARLRRGEIEYLITVSAARAPSDPVRARGLAGRRDASNYSFKPREAAGRGRITPIELTAMVRFPTRRRRAAAG